MPADSLRPLRALIVEDDRDDADLLVLELQRAGYQPTTRRVETLDQLSSALTAEPWEIVLSDFNLCDFTALDALETVKRSGRDIPFIIVSGTIGEETAALAMKRGAHDFFLKDRVNRLPLAIEREVREAANRRERRDAVAHVAENERRFRAIFNQSIAGIAQIDLDGRITVANEQYTRITGRTAPELERVAIRDFVHGDHRDTFDRAFAAAIDDGTGSAFESSYVRPDGTAIWVEHSLSVVVDHAGRPSFAVAIVQDITRRKQMEEELRQAVAIRDDFLAMASHELKTPVTSLELVLTSSLRVLESFQPSTPAIDGGANRSEAIDGGAKRLEAIDGGAKRLEAIGGAKRLEAIGGAKRSEAIDGGAKRSEAIEKVQQRLHLASKQIDRLTTLIRNLLDVTRITSGRLVLMRTHTDLRDVIRDSVERLSEVIARSGSTIEIAAEAPVRGSFDIEALDTVVTNLLANATKYGMGNPIEVSLELLDLELHGPRARITVADRGLGIDEVDQQRIFERFERAVPSSHYGGFGIGLWIVRNIVEAHGGTISVSSAQGQGSRFVVDLPLGEAR